MPLERRWDPCIAHGGDDIDGFLAQYLGRPDRRILLVAGAGFDPRACAVAARLHDTEAVTHALFIKEERRNPSRDQADRAAANTKALLAMLTDRQVERIDIFGSDGAVVGGRSIINVLRRRSLEGITDVVIDVSALSVGTSFPIVRYFVERIVRRRESANVHLFVAHDPYVDAGIRSRPSDTPARSWAGGTCGNVLDACAIGQIPPGVREQGVDLDSGECLGGSGHEVAMGRSRRPLRWMLRPGFQPEGPVSRSSHDVQWVPW